MARPLKTINIPTKTSSLMQSRGPFFVRNIKTGILDLYRALAQAITPTTELMLDGVIRTSAKHGLISRTIRSIAWQMSQLETGKSMKPLLKSWIIGRAMFYLRSAIILSQDIVPLTLLRMEVTVARTDVHTELH